MERSRGRKKYPKIIPSGILPVRVYGMEYLLTPTKEHKRRHTHDEEVPAPVLELGLNLKFYYSYTEQNTRLVNQSVNIPKRLTLQGI